MHNARNTLIPATIALFLSIGVYAYVFLEVRKSGSEIQSIEQRIDAEYEKARRREAVHETLEETAKERDELESRLVKDTSLVVFFEDLESLGREAGVETEIARISENIELDPIVPEATPEGGETKPVRDPATELLEWLQLDIAATGTWTEVYRFLSFVELLPYETRENNIRLQALPATQTKAVVGEDGEVTQPSVSSGGMWELSFTMRVLKLKGE
ncbi:MAG: hypothetical protein WDZ74_01400 [Candidatus Paceibacterota bacterium]